MCFLAFLKVKILIFDATESQKIIFTQNKPSELVQKHQLTLRIQYHDITGRLGSLSQCKVQKTFQSNAKSTKYEVWGGVIMKVVYQ